MLFLWKTRSETAQEFPSRDFCTSLFHLDKIFLEFDAVEVKLQEKTTSFPGTWKNQNHKINKATYRRFPSRKIYLLFFSFSLVLIIHLSFAGHKLTVEILTILLCSSNFCCTACTQRACRIGGFSSPFFFGDQLNFSSYGVCIIFCYDA